MKKLLILILTLTLFSCQNTQNQENNNNSGNVETGNIEIINSGEIEENIDFEEDFNDEEFLNSEENKINKQKARECIKKYVEVVGDEIGDQFYDFREAFEYNGKCYFIDYHQLHLYTIEDNLLKNIFSSTFSNEIYNGCLVKYNISVASIDEMDKIFIENNITPPRIIYTEEDLKNEELFVNLEKIEIKNNLREFDETVNFLNYYYKYKKSSDYKNIKDIFNERLNENIEIFKKIGNCEFSEVKYEQINFNDLEKIKKELGL